MNNVILSATGIEKSYPQGSSKLEIIKGLDLEVHQGQALCIVGASGAGKSTLLHILGTLDQPTQGEVFFKGEKLFAKSEDDLAKFRNQKLGFVFQFHHLLREFSALENVMMPALIAHGVADPQIEADALALLDAVGLKAHAHKKPAQLSGGQQQRVAIARALALRPRLILADEPTGNLDTRTADDIFALLREFNHQTRCACLIVTHDPRLAARCDRTVTLVDGRLVI